MDKIQVLKAMGCLNRRPEAVTFELFRTHGQFFDPSDKVQVRYEMLRAVRVDGLSVTGAARAFGCSRETYYNVARGFELEGCVGLLDQAQGRRQPEKLHAEIVDFILTERLRDLGENSGARLAEKVFARFHVRVHRRTIYKVLKKGAPLMSGRKRSAARKS